MRQNKIRTLSFIIAFIIIASGISAKDQLTSQKQNTLTLLHYKSILCETVRNTDALDASLTKCLQISQTPLLIPTLAECSANALALERTAHSLQNYPGFQSIANFAMHSHNETKNLLSLISNNIPINTSVISQLSKNTAALLHNLTTLLNESSSITLNTAKDLSQNYYSQKISELNHAESRLGVPNLNPQPLTPNQIPQSNSFSPYEAQEIIAKFTGIKQSKLKYNGITKNNTHIFICNANGGKICAEVNAITGVITKMSNSRSPVTAPLSLNNAKSIASLFLQKQNVNDAKLISSYVSNNRALLNFARVKNSTVLYPDHITITIALDNGEIVGFNRSNYLAAQGLKALENLTETLSKENAEKLLPPNVKTLKHNLCITKNNSLAHEFLCQDLINNSKFILFANMDSTLHYSAIIT